MEVHGYTESGSILATIDGIQMTVPDNMANRHRQMIAEWEGQGNTIPPYIPVPEPLPPISPRQIRLALASIGITESNIDTHLSDDALGMIEWKFATQFKRDHPLVTPLAQIFELSDQEVDSLWEWASGL